MTVPLPNGMIKMQSEEQLKNITGLRIMMVCLGYSSCDCSSHTYTVSRSS